MKRIFFSVGEPSGDLHGSNLIRQLKSLGQPVECVGFGGPKMKTAGLEQHYDLTQHAVMMLFTVIKKLRFFFSLVDKAEAYFQEHQVDAVVLIDYPGFNWHIAKRAKKHGIPVFYYGVPQVWAWAPWRVRKIRKYVDHVLCKLPFEKPWFENRGCKATYVGHPFFDQLATQEYDQTFITAFKTSAYEKNPAEKAPVLESATQIVHRQREVRSASLAETSSKTLLLLPGSRNREVRDNLPGMIQAAKLCQNQVPDVRVVIGFFNQQQCDAGKELVADAGLNCELFVNCTPELMKLADVCVACSGSVSLELMYHRLPTIIVYRIGRFTHLLEKVLIRARFVTLVNLLRAPKITRDGCSTYDPDAAGAEHVAMPEYLSSSDKSTKVAARLVDWMLNEPARQSVIDELGGLAAEFGIPGASDRAANYIATRLGILDQRERKAA